MKKEDYMVEILNTAAWIDSTEILYAESFIEHARKILVSFRNDYRQYKSPIDRTITKIDKTLGATFGSEEVESISCDLNELCSIIGWS